MNIRENLGHLVTTLLHLLVHNGPRGLVGNQVRSAHRETIVQVELSDDTLHVVDELAGTFASKVIEDDVNHLANCALDNDAARQLTVLDLHATRSKVHERERGRNQLGTGPRAILAGELPLDLGQHVQGKVLGNADRLLTDAVGTRHRVLKQLDDGRVGAGTDDVAQNRCEVPQLHGRSNALGHVHVHLVTVKVCVVGTGGGDVETEGRVRQNANAVRHHRRLVERRLTIKQHNVAIHQVAVDNVAVAQINRVGCHVAQTDHALILLEKHGLGARVLLGTICNCLQQAVAVVHGHHLGEGQVRRNLERNTELVQLNVGIGRNDGAGREVHTLAHQIAADTAGLGTEARLESTKRTARALGSRLESLDLIVHIGGNVVLQHCSVLVDRLDGLALVNLVAETLVVAENVDQLVGQVVLHALVVVHHDRRADGQRRHSKNCADHPLGAGEARAESDARTVGIGDALKGTEHQLHLEGSRDRCGLVLYACRVSLESRDTTDSLGNLLEERTVAVRT